VLRDIAEKRELTDESRKKIDEAAKAFKQTVKI
jgi:hypothetical protein